MAREIETEKKNRDRRRILKTQIIKYCMQIQVKDYLDPFCRDR